jgi:hypothetical protein
MVRCGSLAVLHLVIHETAHVPKLCTCSACARVCVELPGGCNVSVAILRDRTHHVRRSNCSVRGDVGLAVFKTAEPGRIN